MNTATISDVTSSRRASSSANSATDDATRLSSADKLRALFFQFRGAFIMVGVFGIVINLLLLTVPLYMLNIFSRVFSSRSTETLLMLTIVAVGLLVLQAALDLIRSRLLVRVGAHLDAKLSGQVLTATVRAASGTTRRATQGLRDVNELRGFLTGPGIFALFDAPFAPLYVIVIYLLHPALGLIALAGCIVLFGIGYLNELLTRRPMAAYSQASMNAYAQADSFVRNADAIESMGMMPAVLRRWRLSNANTLQALVHASERAGIFSSLAKFVRLSLQISLFGVGAYCFILNEILPGTIIAASILMSRALAPVETSIMTWKGLISVRAAHQRLNTILHNVDVSNDYMKLPAPDGHLSLERIIVVAPGTDHVILKGITLDLVAGECLGVIGLSGAGKTTLAKTICGVLTPRSGVVRIDGADIATRDPDDLGPHLGYLPQDVQLFAGTVSENIARLGIDASPDKVLAAARLAGAHDFILRLEDGYDTLIGDGGMVLSAGQRQHIGFARALFGNPRVVVLDEPSSNMDSVSEHALIGTLARAHALGMTLVVITHRPNILVNANRLLVLHEGAIQMLGPAAEVLARMTEPGAPPANADQVAANADGSVMSVARPTEGPRQTP